MSAWDDTIADTYRDVVAESGDDGTTKREAFDEAGARVASMVARGLLTPEASDLIRSSLERIDNKLSRRADDILYETAMGVRGLDLGDYDPINDLVVVLGAGRRKSWGFVTSEDLEDMDNLRWKNARAAQDSYNRWREDYEVVRPAVATHGTIRSALAASRVSAE